MQVLFFLQCPVYFGLELYFTFAFQKNKLFEQHSVANRKSCAQVGSLLADTCSKFKWTHGRQIEAMQI
jgi:hypothetical protein